MPTGPFFLNHSCIQPLPVLTDGPCGRLEEFRQRCDCRYVKLCARVFYVIPDHDVSTVFRSSSLSKQSWFLNSQRIYYRNLSTEFYYLKLPDKKTSRPLSQIVSATCESFSGRESSRGAPCFSTSWPTVSFLFLQCDVVDAE